MPTLSITNDTILYIYYGDGKGGATNQNKTGVWDSNYQGVFHFGDGSTLSGADSTTNNNTCTLESIPTAETGKINGAMGLDGIAEDCLLTTRINLTNLTLEAWVYRDTRDTRDVIFGNESSVGILSFDDASNDDVYLSQNGGDSTVWTSVPNLAGGWHLVQITY